MFTHSCGGRKGTLLTHFEARLENSEGFDWAADMCRCPIFHNFSSGIWDSSVIKHVFAVTPMNCSSEWEKEYIYISLLLVQERSSFVVK